jgi:hypothetical protein
MTKYYAGIGARDTPKDVCFLMADLATRLEHTHTLRSGGAQGADHAFELGSHGNCEIFRAEDATESSILHAKSFHPAWEKVTDFAKKLMGRNSQILLGRDLDVPVEFVICWTKDGMIDGGTGQGIRIAKDLGIPVYNLGVEDVTVPLKALQNALGWSTIDDLPKLKGRSKDAFTGYW